MCHDRQGRQEYFFLCSLSESTPRPSLTAPPLMCIIVYFFAGILPRQFLNNKKRHFRKNKKDLKFSPKIFQITQKRVLKLGVVKNFQKSKKGVDKDKRM